MKKTPDRYMKKTPVSPFSNRKRSQARLGLDQDRYGRYDSMEGGAAGGKRGFVRRGRG